ncbi:ABC transporter ATP-binding protein [Bacillus sp. FJAT-45350]|uniref:ABC transporter ATP-binding protein n=1 Tax=Bacillus sp. FJAT-45350 TaxID=2011014 RepID=UPI000BB894F9
MKNDVLSFKDVSFAYSKTDQLNILSNLSFKVEQGEFVTLLGPSGSGKSTIFRLITGLEQPLLGEINLNGNPENNRCGKVGYMPQQDMLLEWRTVTENAMLPLEIQGVSKKKAKQRVLTTLKEFGLAGHENDFPHQLSGGMRQRVSFLRAMLSGNDMLLLDEPFSALDAMTRLAMQEWLLEQWEQHQKSVLFITHDIDEALFLSDRILLFSDKPLSHYEELHVPLSRPRKVDDLIKPEMIKLKQELLTKLRKQVKL